MGLFGGLSVEGDVVNPRYAVNEKFKSLPLRCQLFLMFDTFGG